MHTVYPIAMEIAGPTAMFTRPDTGDSPCSYPAPTYSAVKSLFESILWLEGVAIHPLRVELCSPVVYHSYACNYGGPLRNRDAISKNNCYQMFATVLCDVCYKLYAEVMPCRDKSRLTDGAREWDGRTTSPGHAYQDIFNRRLKRGQSFSIPALGWKEFTPSYFGPLRAETRVLSEMEDILIPSMLRETFPGDYATEYHPVYDTDLCIHKGVLVYPERSADAK